MTGKVEIKDEDHGYGCLEVELMDILRLLEQEGQDLTWSILELEATGDADKLGKNMLDIEQEVDCSPQGLIVSWRELVRLANAFHQVINAVIVGSKRTALLTRSTTMSDLYISSELIVEAIDSSIWSVYAKEDVVLQRLQAAFRDVELVTFGLE